jgi:glucokinase
MSAAAYSLGCDIGVTNVKVVRVTRDGQVLSRHTADTNAASSEWPQGVRGFLAQIETDHSPAETLGVAAPGLAAPDGSCIFWMQGRLGEVEGLNWTKFLARPNFVPVVNDAQAALLGEVWQGAARGGRNVILLTLGTGVGGALMVDGQLLRGHIGRAGHLGHVSLDPAGEPDVTNCPGSLESAIGNVTIESRTGGRHKTTHDLIADYNKGDAFARDVWLRSIDHLAAAVASLINVADPETVIIGGGIARAGAALFGPLNAALDRFEWRPHGRRARVVPAALGEYAGALGAAWNALRLHFPGGIG